MPLDKQHVTIQSRIMLPAYFVFSAWVGLVYTFDPGNRVSKLVTLPVFPQNVWGLGFLVIAAAMLLSIALRHREVLLTCALAPLFCWLVFWAGCNVYFAATAEATYSAPAFPGVIAIAVFATMLSLARRDR